MPEPIAIEIENEPDARAVASALESVGHVRLDSGDRCARVTVDGAETSDALVHVLGAVQEVLEQRPWVQATVRLDGREYRMEAS